MAAKWEDEIKRKAKLGIALSNPTKESQSLYDKYKSAVTQPTTQQKATSPNFIKPSDWNETIRKAQEGIALTQPTGEKNQVYQNYQNLTNLKAPTRTDYTSQYQGKIDSVLDNILNSNFSYDVNTDPLYAQYKQTYNREGERAYENAMGEAAALTGGRSSSYAMSAAQQAQNYYSTQLNDKVPELYEAAYGRYVNDLNQKQNQISTMSSLDAAAYQKYLDALNYDRSAYENDRNYYRSNYETDRDYNYNAFLDDRNYTYQQGRDQVSDLQWNKTFDRGVFESDRGYNRGVLESDRTYNRGVLESDRSYSRGVLESDRSYSRGVLESDRSYSLSKDKFNYEKSQDSKKTTTKDELGSLYQGMASANDPRQWLIQNASYLTSDELDFLYKKLPSAKSSEDLYYDEMIKKMQK